MHTMTDQQNKSSNTFGIVLLAAAAGALAGLLFAPKKGTETREDLRNQYNDMKNRTQDRAQQARDQFSSGIDKVSSKASDVADKSREMVHKTADKAKDSADAAASKTKEASNKAAARGKARLQDDDTDLDPPIRPAL